MSILCNPMVVRVVAFQAPLSSAIPQSLLDLCIYDPIHISFHTCTLTDILCDSLPFINVCLLFLCDYRSSLTLCM